MEEKEAEAIKLRYASAYTEPGNAEAKGSDKAKMITVSADRSIDADELADIVEARIEEIITNVWLQVPNEYADKLLGGIILTGGGANMKNMETAFKRLTNVQKVRTADFVNLTVNTAYPDLLPHDGTVNTVLSILAKGNDNCAGGNVDNDLFNGNYDGTSAGKDEKKAQDNEEARRAEEEKQRAEAAAAAAKQAEEEAEAARLAAEESKKKNKVHSFWNSRKRFGNTIMAADEKDEMK